MTVKEYSQDYQQFLVPTVNLSKSQYLSELTAKASLNISKYQKQQQLLITTVKLYINNSNLQQ